MMFKNGRGCFFQTRNQFRKWDPLRDCKGLSLSVTVDLVQKLLIDEITQLNAFNFLEISHKFRFQHVFSVHLSVGSIYRLIRSFLTTTR